MRPHKTIGDSEVWGRVCSQCMTLMSCGRWNEKFAGHELIAQAELASLLVYKVCYKGFNFKALKGDSELKRSMPQRKKSHDFLHSLTGLLLSSSIPYDVHLLV